MNGKTVKSGTLRKYLLKVVYLGQGCSERFKQTSVDRGTSCRQLFLEYRSLLISFLENLRTVYSPTQNTDCSVARGL